MSLPKIIEKIEKIKIALKSVSYNYDILSFTYDMAKPTADHVKNMDLNF